MGHMSVWFRPVVRGRRLRDRSIRLLSPPAATAAASSPTMSSVAGDGCVSSQKVRYTPPPTIQVVLYLRFPFSYIPPVASVRLCQGKEREEEDGADGRSQRVEGVEVSEGGVDLGDLYGAAAGWVAARTTCPHLGTMPPAGPDDLARVPPPDSPCSRFGSPPSCSNSLWIIWSSPRFNFCEQR